MDFFVSGSGSMVQKIEYSPAFKMWFKTCQEHAKVKVNKAVANLRAAKHRFESMIKPLARIVLFVDAVIATALRIVAERRDAAAADAKTFLTTISNEKLLQAALMADAADEAGQLIRSCEAEEWDTAQSLEILANFKRKITFLFDEGGVFETSTFTVHMIDFLSTLHTWVVDNRPYTVGFAKGVPENLKQRCNRRTLAWRRLAFSILEAEFPSFSVMAAFPVLNLGNTVASKPATTGEDNDVSVRRLAGTFGLCVHSLKQQIADHVHLANRLKVNHKLTNGDAWQQAVIHTRRHPDTRRDHPSDALREVVKRYRAFAISTGGVERGFSKHMWLVKSNSEHQSDTSAFLQFKAINDFREGEAEDVIARAQVRVSSCKVETHLGIIYAGRGGVSFGRTAVELALKICSPFDSI